MVNSNHVVKEVPAVDRYTGICSVCGLKDAHMWRCIVWFISAGVKFYKENLLDARKIFLKLSEKKYVSDAELREAIAKLDYIKDISENV